ncbi:MAG TPA: PIN domain-containing protein [Longimicrobium sp.]
MSLRPSAAQLPSPPIFRLCLDLNIWCAYALANARKRNENTIQMLVEAVRRGECALGLTQLVISWGLINRLAQVLARKLGFSRLALETVLEEMILTSRLGPDPGDPLIILGGAGVIPLRDQEDVHVLEVAVAGRADVLVTGNLVDFIGYRTEILKPDRIALHRTPDHEVIIARPAEVAAWIRNGAIDLSSGT